MIKYIILGATLLVGAFGFPNSYHKHTELVPLRDGRIVGGTNAPEGSFPFTVYLKSMITGSHFCGGSIIEPSTILTNARCVINTPTSWLVVVAGSHKLSSGGQIREVSAIITHDTDDIAILKLAKPLQLSATVSPVKLAEERVGSDINCDASGWGRTSGGGSRPDRLQYVNLKTISNSDCSAYHSSIKNGEICTLTKYGEGTCSGDDGSPLVINQTTQIGIAIWGISSETCAVGYPDIYTRVSTYLDWIHRNM